MRKHKKGSKTENENLKSKLKENISDVLELPKEITLNLPLITITGRQEVCVENYRGILEYGDNKMRIKTEAGIILIEGKSIVIKHITSEILIIIGVISRFEFLM